MGNKPSARAVGPRNAHLPHRRLLRRPNRGWVKNINPEVQISNHGIPSWPGLMVICGLVVGQKCLENEPLTSKRNGQMQHGSIAILQNNPAGGIKAPLCSEKFKVQGSKFKVFIFSLQYSIFTVFVAFTRVYLGVHTITDVLGGAALGIAAYLLADILWKRIPEKFKKKLGVME